MRVAISGHQGSSGVISGTHLEGREQGSSGVIRGTQGYSGVLTWRAASITASCAFIKCDGA